MLYLDIVDFSLRQTAGQFWLKERLNAALTKATAASARATASSSAPEAGPP